MEHCYTSSYSLPPYQYSVWTIHILNQEPGLPLIQDHASYCRLPGGLMANFEMGHIHTITHTKINHYTHLLALPTSLSLPWQDISKSRRGRRLICNGPLACWLNHSHERLHKTGAMVVNVVFMCHMNRAALVCSGVKQAAWPLHGSQSDNPTDIQMWKAVNLTT